jgi:hypothetical protein
MDFDLLSMWRAFVGTVIVFFVLGPFAPYFGYASAAR